MSVLLRPPSPGSEAGIDDALIRRVVDAFYARVRADDMLGPIFNAAVHDWPDHLERLYAFWSSLTLMTGTYRGRPLQAHFKLPDLSDEHFLRWLGLFRATLAELCTPVQAQVFMVRAERIADSFRFGLAARRGELAAPLGDGTSPA